MPFLLTTLAGLSTMIGTILIFIFKRKNKFVILASLSFAAGVMLVASIFDFINIFKYRNYYFFYNK